MARDNWVWSYIHIDEENTYNIACFEEVGEYGFSSSWILKLLSEIEADGMSNRVRLLFNSPGGDAIEGISIYNILNNSNLDIEGVVVGMAASAAAIAFMGCKTRQMYPHSLIMIHRVMVNSYGMNPEDMRKSADDAEKIEGQTRDIILRRTGQSEEIVATWFDGNDHWFNGAESLDNGLCTEVVDNDIIPDATTTSQTRNNVTTVWQNYQTKYNQLTQEAMLKKKLISIFKLQQNATDDEVLAALDNVSQSNNTDTAEKDKKIADLEAEIKAYKDAETAQKAEEETRAATEVEQAFQKGSINQSQKDTYLKLAKTSPKEVLQLVQTIEPPKTFGATFQQHANGAQDKPLSMADSFEQFYNNKNGVK